MTTIRVKPKGVLRKKTVVSNEVMIYIWETFILPTVKTVAADIFDTFLFGKSGRDRGGRPFGGSTSTRVNYGGGFRGRLEPKPEYLAVRPAFKELDDLVFETQAEVNTVINDLYDRADQYGFATVADLNDIVGISGDYTANNFGWAIEDLQRHRISPIRDGWVLNLPNTRPLPRKQ